MTKEETFALLTRLAAAYPNKEITKPTIRLYADRLSDLPAELLRETINRAIDTLTFFPTIAELRKSAIEISGKSCDEAQAIEAWGELRKMMRQIGFYQEPVFSDPLMEKAVHAIGGWRHLCSSENLTSERARFIEAYSAFGKREADAAARHSDFGKLTDGKKDREILEMLSKKAI